MCDRPRVGRGTTRAEDAQGTPNQGHISPSTLVCAAVTLYRFCTELHSQVLSCFILKMRVVATFQVLVSLAVSAQEWIMYPGQAMLRLTWEGRCKATGRGNSSSQSARPFHHIISMIKWTWTCRLSIKNSLSLPCTVAERIRRGPPTYLCMYVYSPAARTSRLSITKFLFGQAASHGARSLSNRAS